MNRIATAASALLLALPALAADPGGSSKGAGVPPGKPSAPVTVSARLASGRATVTVRFRSPASDVAIEVHGVDGLSVTSSPTPLAGGRFARGQSVTFDVDYTPGPGRSHLAVAVAGRFGTAVQRAVSSFAVGQPTAEQLKPAAPPVTDSAGQRIKIMPAEGK